MDSVLKDCAVVLGKFSTRKRRNDKAFFIFRVFIRNSVFQATGLGLFGTN